MQVMSTHNSMFNVSNRKLLTVVSVIFWTGTLTLVALALGVFIAVVYLINLTLDAVTELAVNLASLYSHTDSLGKILLWMVALYIFVKIGPWVVRSLRKSYQSLHTLLHW
jgi:hypothetical protein